MKKIARILVCLLVIVTTLTAAHAEGVELAAQMMELDSFAHYPSYAHDAQTGKWSLQSYQADALLDRFWSYGIR
ncbi:MAG: hypothetical protein IKK75_07150, partial [Clostridia bacterium]|nr:hypothetical protein [Clostridia bacterium]